MQCNVKRLCKILVECLASGGWPAAFSFRGNTLSGGGRAYLGQLAFAPLPLVGGLLENGQHPPRRVVLRLCERHVLSLLPQREQHALASLSSARLSLPSACLALSSAAVRAARYLFSSSIRAE